MVFVLFLANHMQLLHLGKATCLNCTSKPSHGHRIDLHGVDSQTYLLGAPVAFQMEFGRLVDLGSQEIGVGD